MRLPSFRTEPRPVDVGPAGYQEFTAGTVPVRRVAADWQGDVALIEHERGYVRVFDEHLHAVRRRAAQVENVDYVVTWTAITGVEPWPAVVRLELTIDGLRSRPRLLFRGHTMRPLWLLADGAWLGLVLDPVTDPADLPDTHTWLLGPTPVPDGLARILRDVGVPRRVMPGRPQARQLRVRRALGPPPAASPHTDAASKRRRAS